MNATFVTTHYVSKEYHENHPQLLHRHKDELELLYFVDGEGTYMVDGKEYYVSPGVMVVCNAGIMHGESPLQTRAKESYCCVFTDVHIEDLPQNTLMPRGVSPVLFFDSGAGAVGHIYRALHYYASQKDQAEICDHLAKSVLSIAMDEIRRRETPVPEQEKSETEFVRSITDYLDDHFAEEISMEVLSEKFHISPYYLFRFFKKGTGMAPMKYIMIRRIGEAQNLLMNSDAPIGNIGWQIGFEETAYFSRQFRRYVGVTPTEFRAFHQNKKEK